MSTGGSNLQILKAVRWIDAMNLAYITEKEVKKYVKQKCELEFEREH